MRTVHVNAHVVWITLIALAAVPGLAGCASTMTIEQARAELDVPTTLTRRHVAAMELFDEQAPDDPHHLAQLHGLIWQPGYVTQVREQALLRLEQRDLDGLKRTIRQRLPRLTALHWLERLSQIIVERGWEELTPALVSSWARPMPLSNDETRRPEYQALVALHGEDRVVDVIYELFLESRSVSEQGLRARCWDLMHRLGQRNRLVSLISSTEVHAEDAMLLDLRAGADELGIVPANREELLWMRTLREPARRGFWNEAAEAMSRLPREIAVDLELRNLPVVVAAARHQPELLDLSEQELYRRVEAYISAQTRHVSHSNYGNLRQGTAERLGDHRQELTWGDLAAMLMAVAAVEVPELVDHLFHYAERDRADTTTEYGGILALDSQGRFELLEFPPVMRRHDNEFIASQAMLDAGYTALFHFHFHAQRHRNAAHAGPGFGDLNYADNTRANCLVFTFINRDTLNMDYYRHGSVVVDLGEVTRR